MSEKINESIQWVGAVAIIAGHVLNSLGSAYHRDLWNMIAFAIGIVAFMAWAYRTRNRAQLVVNIVSIVICLTGLYKSLSQ